MDLLSGLNERQAEAVRTKSGPLLILAGAGSGKTKTLTHRIAYLIAEQNIEPNRILAVTFTNKAAREMRERLASLLGRSSNDRNFMPWMGTFHSVCVRLLRLDGQAIGISKNFVIYDEDDRVSLIKRVIKTKAISGDNIKPRSVSGVISSSKNELISPDDFERTAQSQSQRQIAQIYAGYEHLRREAGALDFDDLLIETVRLLRESSEVRSKWRAHFQHILIDEYQDTNAAQYAIVRSLVGDERNICVVGDDWQSIYSWRGADFTNILNFERDFPGTKVVKLEQNYRSSGAILEAAGNVIDKNTQRSQKKLWTASGRGSPVEVRALYDESEEAAMVADLIAAQVQIGARGYGDFAILYRTNAQSYTMERALRQRLVPHQIIGGVRFFDRAVIKDVISYLKLIYQPNDSVSFGRIVNVPKRGIGPASLDKFLTFRADNAMDIVTALENLDQTDIITKARLSLESLGAKLRRLQGMIEEVLPAKLIEALLDETGYRDFINDGTPQADDKLENIGSLISEAQAFADLPTFLEEVALVSSVDKSSDGQSVTLMTLHAAKGLEFPVVFMVGMEEGVFPHSRVFESDPKDLEEERRLCYVGMTRAREELHLSYTMSRLHFGQRSVNQPSRFLVDMGAEIVKPQSHDFSPAPQAEFVSDELPFSVGDRVRSYAFGNGEIVDIDGMAVSIRFDNGQTKKLNAEYARLEKIG